MEHTKGKVSVVKFAFHEYIKDENGNDICQITKIQNKLSPLKDGFEEECAKNVETEKANAELIAEAFNTTNESGLTPSQLYKQNQELLEALKKSKDKISELFTKGVDFAKINSELFTILEQAINNAKTK